jgi:solute carrier family 8 (sodium/calcium exchanger)
MGTSVPDTFASMLAAKNDPYADASIGNITGSNSVNVFLGLGLPWTFASIYHASNGSVYEVPAGKLGMNVAFFTSFAVVALAGLMIKRRYVGAELGGEKIWKWGFAGFLAFLWVLYILLSSLSAYGHI